MTVIDIDLTKNPDLAALVADKEPGDWIELRASIKAKDDQTLSLRLEECDDCEKSKDEGDEEDSADTADETDSEDAPEKAAEKPGKSLAAKLAPESTPGY